MALVDLQALSVGDECYCSEEMGTTLFPNIKRFLFIIDVQSFSFGTE